jgi:hypothetical protein
MSTNTSVPLRSSLYDYSINNISRSTSSFRGDMNGRVLQSHRQLHVDQMPSQPAMANLVVDARTYLAELADVFVPLLPDVEMSLHSWLTNDSPRAVFAMLETMQTGRPAFDRVFGMSYFDRLQQDPVAAARFQDDMHHSARWLFDDISLAYPWESVGTVIDVGGGSGCVLSILLGAYPHLHGVLVDLPDVLENPCASFRAFLGSRANVCSANFFASVPSPADVYILARILHDWDDAAALHILRVCKEAAKDGELLIVDHLIEHPVTASAALSDLEMFTLTGGVERNRAQFDDLLGQAGLRIVEIRKMRSGLSAIRATRPRL